MADYLITLALISSGLGAGFYGLAAVIREGCEGAATVIRALRGDPATPRKRWSLPITMQGKNADPLLPPPPS